MLAQNPASPRDFCGGEALGILLLALSLLKSCFFF